MLEPHITPSQESQDRYATVMNIAAKFGPPFGPEPSDDLIAFITTQVAEIPSHEVATTLGHSIKQLPEGNISWIIKAAFQYENG